METERPESEGGAPERPEETEPGAPERPEPAEDDDEEETNDGGAETPNE